MHDQLCIDARQVRRAVSVFAQPVVARSIFELAITVVVFMLVWALTWLSLATEFWPGMVLALPAGGLLLRLFVIQHDCGHGSLFLRRATNDWVGRSLSVLTLTPYDSWRRSHSQHHATSGNLGKRGTGDIDTLTVAEYQGRSSRQRLRYRLYRHPINFFLVGPAYTFLLRHRFPAGFSINAWRSWLSTLTTNAAIGTVAGLLIWKIGIAQFMVVHLPIALIAATAGVREVRRETGRTRTRQQPSSNRVSPNRQAPRSPAGRLTPRKAPVDASASSQLGRGISAQVRP